MSRKFVITGTLAFGLSLLSSTVFANALGDQPQYQMAVLANGDHGVASVMILDEKSGKVWEIDEQQQFGAGSKETWIRYIADVSKLPDGQKIGSVVESTLYVDKHPVAPSAPSFPPSLIRPQGGALGPSTGAPAAPHSTAR